MQGNAVSVFLSVSQATIWDCSSVHTYQVGVPHSDNVAHAHLAHQQAIHPTKGKLHVLYAVLLQMRMQRRVDACHQLSQPAYLSLDAGLRKDVVVLDAIEELREAPERVGFDGLEHIGWQQGDVKHFGVRVDVGAEKDFEEGGSEVVDALNVAAGWMSDRPNVQDPLERALGGLTLP